MVFAVRPNVLPDRPPQRLSPPQGFEGGRLPGGARLAIVAVPVMPGFVSRELNTVAEYIFFPYDRFGICLTSLRLESDFSCSIICYMNRFSEEPDLVVLRVANAPH